MIRFTKDFFGLDVSILENRQREYFFIHISGGHHWLLDKPGQRFTDLLLPTRWLPLIAFLLSLILIHILQIGYMYVSYFHFGDRLS